MGKKGSSGEIFYKKNFPVAFIKTIFFWLRCHFYLFFGSGEKKYDYSMIHLSVFSIQYISGRYIYEEEGLKFLFGNFLGKTLIQTINLKINVT